MKKIVALLMLLFTYIYALSEIAPFKKITYKEYISKIAFNENYLIVGLENGEIIIQNYKNLKKIYSFKLPKIHDFMGDLIAMPIYSIDIFKNKVLILAEGEEAKREFFIFNLKTKKLSHIFTTKDTLMKARFIDNEKIFFALLSDEITLYSLKEKRFLYKKQIGNYVFSTYALNQQKDKAAIGDESGSIKIIQTLTGRKINKIKGFNKDKTLSLDFKQNLVINGSSDMKVGIYSIHGVQKAALKANFLPYAVALSPNLKKFATQFNDKNNIMVYSIYKKPLYLLKGHSMALNGMKFLNNSSLLSYSPAEIIIWKGLK